MLCLLVQSVILIHWLVWKKIQPWHKGWDVFSCRYVLITAKCFHWLQQREHSWKQHGWWFIGALALPFTKPSPCCLRTLFWNKIGNVRQTCGNACCGCCLEGLPAGSPQWLRSCGYRASLAGRLWLLLGCTGASLQKRSRYWRNWAACSGGVNVGVDRAALVVWMSCHVIPNF